MPRPLVRFRPIAIPCPVVACITALLVVTTFIPGCTGKRHAVPHGHTVTFAMLMDESSMTEAISRGESGTRQHAAEQENVPQQGGAEPAEDPRTFLALWYGGNKQVGVDETIESPSPGFPGPVGVRLPEVETAPTPGGENERQWKSVSNVLLRRGSASVDAAGTITLESGVVFMISETTEVKAGAVPQTLLYPIIVRTNPLVETGTVGTDWLCYVYERPAGGGGTEEVLLVCMIKSDDPSKGVWLRWNNQLTATMETNMTFVEFVDGTRSFWPPRAVNLDCDSTDQSPTCLIGRVLKDTIQSAKAIGMIPESYLLPTTP